MENKKKISIEDFELIQKLGEGAFGEVLLVKKKDNGEKSALKIIDKKFL